MQVPAHRHEVGGWCDDIDRISHALAGNAA
jgi:hypothetical protein